MMYRYSVTVETPQEAETREMDKVELAHWLRKQADVLLAGGYHPVNPEPGDTLTVSILVEVE